MVLHPEKYLRDCNGLEVRRIADSINMPVAVETLDDGYHEYGNAWWTNTDCPLSFQYLAIDPMYNPLYFDAGAHPDEKEANDLFQYMRDCYRKIYGRDFESVLELGTGGGEISGEFAKAKLDYLAVEGTTAGCKKLQRRGIPEERIAKADLRRSLEIGRNFDLVMCTEVIEHIEPFFAAKVVENCTLHADTVWFSAADRNRAAHYHHINEQDIEAWDNLFAFLGFSISVELDGRLQRADRIYIKDELESQILFGA